MKVLAAALVACLALSACAEKEKPVATQARTPYQSVVVNTPGVTGANCVVQSGSNTYSVKAPGSVMVRRAPDVMTISCFKGNHMRGQASARPSFAPSEGEAVRGTQISCMTCNYPTTISVAMSLNSGSMEVPFTILPN